jgi:hypothetical protein
MENIHAPNLPRNIDDLSPDYRALLSEIAAVQGETPETMLEIMLLGRAALTLTGATTPEEAIVKIATIKRQAAKLPAARREHRGLIIRRHMAAMRERTAVRLPSRSTARARAPRRARVARISRTASVASADDGPPPRPLAALSLNSRAPKRGSR